MPLITLIQRPFCPRQIVQKLPSLSSLSLKDIQEEMVSEVITNTHREKVEVLKSTYTKMDLMMRMNETNTVTFKPKYI